MVDCVVFFLLCFGREWVGHQRFYSLTPNLAVISEKFGYGIPAFKIWSNVQYLA